MIKFHHYCYHNIRVAQAVSFFKLEIIMQRKMVKFLCLQSYLKDYMTKCASNDHL